MRRQQSRVEIILSGAAIIPNGGAMSQLTFVVVEVNPVIDWRGFGNRSCRTSAEMRVYRGYAEDGEEMQRIAREGRVYKGEQEQLVASGKSEALRWVVLSKKEEVCSICLQFEGGRTRRAEPQGSCSWIRLSPRASAS